jgi:hypothetical protein
VREKKVKKILNEHILSFPTAGKGSKRDLTTTLTFVLSRKGREEMNGKLFQRTPHPDPLPQGERFDEEKRI